MIQEICLECGQIAVLNKHVRKHGLTSEEYYRKWLMKPNEGFCKVCGKPTKFCGLSEKCFQPYCSNKCHNSDAEYLADRSEKRKNLSPEAKAAIRAKQIKTWETTMGNDWAKIMAHNGFETYKKRTGYDTPWHDPAVKQKCRERWNNENSPACLADVKEKISKSTKTYFDETKEERIALQLKHLQEKCKDLIAIDGNWKIYKCPNCGAETKIGSKAIGTAVKYNDFNHLCSKCHCMNGTSFKEQELISFLKTFDETIIEHDRTILAGKELDAYMPNLNVAFEFDGTYWHADPRFFNEDAIMRYNHDGSPLTAGMIWTYDNEKTLLCQTKNIKLIRIQEYDWINNREYIKNKISEVIKNVKCNDE